MPPDTDDHAAATARPVTDRDPVRRRRQPGGRPRRPGHRRPARTPVVARPRRASPTCCRPCSIVCSRCVLGRRHGAARQAVVRAPRARPTCGRRFTDSWQQGTRVAGRRLEPAAARGRRASLISVVIGTAARPAASRRVAARPHGDRPDRCPACSRCRRWPGCPRRSSGSGCPTPRSTWSCCSAPCRRSPTGCSPASTRCRRCYLRVGRVLGARGWTATRHVVLPGRAARLPRRAASRAGRSPGARSWPPSSSRLSPAAGHGPGPAAADRPRARPTWPRRRGDPADPRRRHRDRAARVLTRSSAGCCALARPHRGVVVSSPSYPVVLDLAGRRVVVVGGGPVAARRASSAVAAGGLVEVVAPWLCEELASLVADRAVQWHARDYTEGDLAGAWFVHTATGDRSTDDAVAGEAERRGSGASVPTTPPPRPRGLPLSRGPSTACSWRSPGAGIPDGRRRSGTPSRHPSTPASSRCAPRARTRS